MYIEPYMSVDVSTISPETVIPEARDLLRQKSFRHLPVVDDAGQLVGMITDRDLRSAFPSTVMGCEVFDQAMERIRHTTVGSIMSTRLATLTRLSTLDDALLLLDRDRVGGLPVVDEDNHVVGFFSIRDLMRAYKTLFGIGEPGSSLVTIVNDGKERPLTRIVRTLEEHGTNVTRMVKSRQPGTDEDIIYVRVHTYNIKGVHRALEEAGFRIIQLRHRT